MKTLRQLALVIMVGVALAGPVSAQSVSDLIEDTEVQGQFWAMYLLTPGIEKMGAVVAVAVGGFFAFLIVSMALGWGRTALAGGSYDEEENDEL